MPVDLNEIDVIVVDGSNLLWRNSYANAGLGYRTDAGFQPTGGVYGFFESLFPILRLVPEDVDVWVCWEGQRSRMHRRAVVPGYKVREPDEKREKLAQLVSVQASILRATLKHTRFHQASSPEWEGDDVMGTIATKASLQGDNVMIMSGDGDLLQLLRSEEGHGEVIQYKPSSSKKEYDPVWTEARFVSETGVDPIRLIDVKALAGDSSDCYKGVPGIGEKWAQRIVAGHGPITRVISDAQDTGKLCNSEAKARAVIDHTEDLMACLDVATIRTSVPVKLTTGDADKRSLKDAFRRLRFNTIASDSKVDALT